MTKKVKVRIKATVTDLVLSERYLTESSDGSFRADNGEIYPTDKIFEICSEIIEYTLWGEYIEDGNKRIIRYNEGEEIGVENCMTTLIFESDNRSCLIMTRDGDISTACKFDMSEKRQFCRYETPIIPVEFTVNTRSVHNTVSENGGAILLDYSIEVHGANTERNKLFIEILKFADQ